MLWSRGKSLPEAFELGQASACDRRFTTGTHRDRATYACARVLTSVNAPRIQPRERAACFRDSIMKILHYMPSFRLTRGGPVRAVIDLAAGLCSRGHEVTLLTCEVGDLPSGWVKSTGATGSSGTVDPTSLTPTVVEIPQEGIGNEPINKKHAAEMQACVRACDVLHVHGVWNFSNVQMARLARANSKPYLVSLRGMLDDWSMEQKALKKRIFHLLIYKKFLERAAAIHCTAQAELDQSKKWFPKGNGVVIANMLDLNPFRTPPGPDLARQKFPMLTNGRPNVLFLSRLHYKKGVEVLVQAAAMLRDQSFEVNCIFAGTGDADYAARMQELVTELQLDDRVFFVGHVAGPLKISLYQAADLFALPTSQENFGFVFPEALASGTPIITTKGVDIWGELQGGGAASIVDRTPGAFASEIRAILTDRVRFSAMQVAAKPFVFKEYDEGLLMDQFESLYRATVAR
jgi:glycosyltransferase involved in cell wall biosynthesis